MCVKIEDLRIGQKVYVNGQETNIIGLLINTLDDSCPVKTEANGWLKLSMVSLTPPKKNKRYWLWDVKDSNGNIGKFDRYLSDNGEFTNGGKLMHHFTLLKKHENEFIDVEEE